MGKKAVGGDVENLYKEQAKNTNAKGRQEIDYANLVAFLASIEVLIY